MLSEDGYDDSYQPFDGSNTFAPLPEIPIEEDGSVVCPSCGEHIENTNVGNITCECKEEFIVVEEVREWPETDEEEVGEEEADEGEPSIVDIFA